MSDFSYNFIQHDPFCRQRENLWWYLHSLLIMWFEHGSLDICWWNFFTLELCLKIVEGIKLWLVGSVCWRLFHSPIGSCLILDLGFNPWSGQVQEAADRCLYFSLPLSLLPSPPLLLPLPSCLTLSLKIKKTYTWVKIKNKKDYGEINISNKYKYFWYSILVI